MGGEVVTQERPGYRQFLQEIERLWIGGSLRQERCQVGVQIARVHAVAGLLARGAVDGTDSHYERTPPPPGLWMPAALPHQQQRPGLSQLLFCLSAHVLLRACRYIL